MNARNKKRDDPDMNQRLVWNFEFVPNRPLPLARIGGKEREHLKWEARCFWADNQTIILNTIDNALLNLANYQQKFREDYYYLLPDCNYNIKRRRNELVYKPLEQQSPTAQGFSAKINLGQSQDYQAQANYVHLEKIAQQIEKEGIGIYVRKEALIYKFPTTPGIKLELARLEVLNKVYFSLCVEGKSLDLVETIFKHLLDEPISCDYVTFLKNILKS